MGLYMLYFSYRNKSSSTQERQLPCAYAGEIGTVHNSIRCTTKKSITDKFLFCKGLLYSFGSDALCGSVLHSAFFLNIKKGVFRMMNTKKEVTLSTYMTVEDVRQYLNLSSSKAYALTHQKGFPVCRFGSSIRIPRDAFLMWVKQMSSIPDNLVVA